MRVVRLPNYAPDFKARPGETSAEGFVVLQRPRPQDSEEELGRLRLTGWSSAFYRL
jgi:hypothetical protein